MAWFRDAVERYWSVDRAALVVESESVCGLSSAAVARVASGAAVVVRLSAPYAERLAPPLDAISPAILVDTDPGYTHLWAGDDPTSVFGAFDVYFTVGANIGTKRSSLPTCGIDSRRLPSRA